MHENKHPWRKLTAQCDMMMNYSAVLNSIVVAEGNCRVYILKITLKPEKYNRKLNEDMLFSSSTLS